MRDIVITDIPQEHYDAISEAACELGISADDYLTILVKGYCMGLGAQAGVDRLAKDADDGIEGLSV